MATVHSGEEILPKVSTPWAGCTNVTYRRLTDRQMIDGFTMVKTRTWHSHVQVKSIGLFSTNSHRYNKNTEIFYIKQSIKSTYVTLLLMKCSITIVSENNDNKQCKGRNLLNQRLQIFIMDYLQGPMGPRSLGARTFNGKAMAHPAPHYLRAWFLVRKSI